jgi:hypothetical protein
VPRQHPLIKTHDRAFSDPTGYDLSPLAPLGPIFVVQVLARKELISDRLVRGAPVNIPTRHNPTQQDWLYPLARSPILLGYSSHVAGVARGGAR